MKKPKVKTVKLFDWSECTAFIEKKHGINTEDYANCHGQFGEWCEAKGYSGKDPEGKPMGESRIWFAEFSDDKTAIGRPFQNFWHWLIDSADVRRGGTIELNKEMGDGQPEWVNKILGLYLREFGKGPYRTNW